MWLTIAQKCCRFRTLQSYSVFSAYSSGIARNVNASTIVVPIRHFGQGEKIRIFGHAKVRSPHKDYTSHILAVPLVMVVILCIDWKSVKERFGINAKALIHLKTSAPIGVNLNKRVICQNALSPFQDITNLIEAAEKSKIRPDRDFYYGVQENKSTIHEEMKREAMKRYDEELKEMVKQDPELKALIEGQDPATIKVADKEVFELKKQWVADYLKLAKEVEKRN